MNIDLGGGNILRNQDLIVQVKHTGEDQSKTIPNHVRKKIFETEKKKVEKLVKENQLDTTYIMLTNYKLSAIQEGKFNKCFNAAKNVPAKKGIPAKKGVRGKKGVRAKNAKQNHSDELENCFKGAGAKHVLIIGKETLSQWLGDYPELQMKVIRYYPRGHIGDLMHCSKAVISNQMLERYREDLENITDVKAFTKAKEIVESDKGLVFITGVPGSGKTTVAKQLVVHLSQ